MANTNSPFAAWFALLAVVGVAPSCSSAELGFTCPDTHRKCTISLGERRREEFVITNLSDSELVFSGATSSCTCVSLAVPELRIPPHQSQRLPLDVEGKLLGVQNTRVLVRVNSIAQPTLELTTDVTVGGGLIVEPREFSVSLDQGGAFAEVGRAILICADQVPPKLALDTTISGLEIKAGAPVTTSLDGGVFRHILGISGRMDAQAAVGRASGTVIISAACGAQTTRVERRACILVRRGA